MKYQLLVRPAVEGDIAEAEAWYERQRSGLGSEFTQTIREAIPTLLVNPLIYRVRHERLGVRWFYPPRFPYRIVYRIRGDAIVVLGVVHAARHDRVWRERARRE